MSPELVLVPKLFYFLQPQKVKNLDDEIEMSKNFDTNFTRKLVSFKQGFLDADLSKKNVVQNDVKS